MRPQEVGSRWKKEFAGIKQVSVHSLAATPANTWFVRNRGIDANIVVGVDKQALEDEVNYK